LLFLFFILSVIISLESDCRTVLKRIMHIRTQAIGLMPEIENNCIQDLTTCKNPEIKGEVRKDLKNLQ